MGHRFAELAFTPAVKALQGVAGSRANYARMEEDALVPVVDEILDDNTDLEIWTAHMN